MINVHHQQFIMSKIFGIKLFLSFLKDYKIQVCVLVSLCIITGAIASIDSFILKNITDTIENYHDLTVKDLPKALLKWAIIYGLWWEGINWLGRLYDYIYLRTLPKIKADILSRLYNHTQHHSYSFFQKNMAGHITNRITEGARSFEIVFSLLNEKIIHKLAVIIFALITMYWVHSSIANIFLTWLVLFIGLSAFFSKKVNNYSMNYARSKSIVAGKIVDSIANISAIRMYNSQNFERRYLDNYIGSAASSETILQWFMLKLRYVLGLSCSVMICVIIYSLAVLRSELLISIGDCILILTLCLAVVDDVWDLTQEIGDLFEEIGSFNQSISLNKPHTIIDTANAKLLEIDIGKIEFRNVTFNYKNNKNIFKNKSIIIEGKQKVGLVGFSGSGKTTFVNLITRLFEIEGGEILIDQQNINDISQTSLRDQISIIPQEPILFHRSIMDNIRYGKPSAGDYEVIEAAKAAHIHDDITNLPLGYETQCGERGNNLSGGQRQRVIIARALLKNAPLLFMDEATSALDSNTEHLIQESLKNLMNGKTVLVIAHRLSTLLTMDRILVFEAGTIIEDGSHAELVKNSHLYKKLWKSQIKGLIAENP